MGFGGSFGFSPEMADLMGLGSGVEKGKWVRITRWESNPHQQYKAQLIQLSNLEVYIDNDVDIDINIDMILGRQLSSFIILECLKS
ncbi:hypothetical protein H5410_016661 [Solanum commersonii]|uniref:Uncharacterized protein n=1 Tax=Solanum commersonii TaxID=4109 RepID=A0A9J5ZWV8_SOLCO|nr:hypothetical protein H5410_016661 [Solanum commersonii]